MNIDGFSLSPLVSELHNALSGGRIDRIFQPDETTLAIWVRQPGTNHRLIISANASRPGIFLSQKLNLENPATPPTFCMLLRKHLVDGRISAITQQGLDRVIIMSIDVRDEYGSIVTKHLSIELMGKHSNIVLLTDSLIIDAIKRVTTAMSRHRQILPGKPYVNPPVQTGINLLSTPASDFVAAVRTQSGLLHKAIVTAGIGLGPVTAKELVCRAGLRADIKVDEINQTGWEALALAVQALVTTINSGHINPTVVTDHQHFKAIAAFSLEHLANFTTEHFPSMSDAVEFAAQLASGGATPAKDKLKKLITGELSRLERKCSTLQEEQEQALGAETLRCSADILMANLFAIPTCCEKISLPNLYSDDPEKNLVDIALDPRLTPLENAQNYYARYNKLKRAQPSLAAQITQCREEINYLESVLVSLEQAAGSSDLADIRAELIESGYIKEHRKKRIPTASKPLSAVTTSGMPILIGKNNIQNDSVTFKQADANDIWFHTKNIPGSHVILKTAASEPSPADLYQAAQLAAYFSKARQSANVPVDYTARRFVKKPTGAKPGFVIYDHQSTLYVTPDEELIKQLLKTE